MIQAIVLAALLLVALHASAQSQVYKCEQGGKISYGSAPCTGGTALEPLAPSPAPTSADLAANRRARALLDRLEQERRQQESIEERQRQLDAKQYKKCEQQRLQAKWAGDDAARAPASARASLQLKARRQTQLLAVACPAS